MSEYVKTPTVLILRRSQIDTNKFAAVQTFFPCDIGKKYGAPMYVSSSHDVREDNLLDSVYQIYKTLLTLNLQKMGNLDSVFQILISKLWPWQY